MAKSRRCAIYARVSTEEQDESLQLTALKEFVSQRGWELKAAYVDHGISSRSVRPELEHVTSQNGVYRSLPSIPEANVLK